MQTSAEQDNDVVDLDTYRSRKSVQSKLKLPTGREETEALLNEIAEHLLMAIRAITTRCH
jgi:hypothetical protein